jgi:tRNA-splicing ligase RtcB
VLSRSKASNEFRGDLTARQPGEKRHTIRRRFFAVWAEEAPQAYKDVDEVVETVQGAALPGKEPACALYVIKAENQFQSSRLRSGGR